MKMQKRCPICGNIYKNHEFETTKNLANNRTEVVVVNYTCGFCGIVRRVEIPSGKEQVFRQ